MVIGFRCPADELERGRLLAVLSSAPVEAEWVADASAITCRAGGDVLRLGVTADLWVNLWVESSVPGLLAAVEEALVWGCGAVPVAPQLPERLAWVRPLLDADDPDMRVPARAIVSRWCQIEASVAAGEFGAMLRLREKMLAVAAELASQVRHCTRWGTAGPPTATRAAS